LVADGTTVYFTIDVQDGAKTTTYVASYDTSKPTNVSVNPKQEFASLYQAYDLVVGVYQK
jgi:hypothetical protein